MISMSKSAVKNKRQRRKYINICGALIDGRNQALVVAVKFISFCAKIGLQITSYSYITVQV